MEKGIIDIIAILRKRFYLIILITLITVVTTGLYSSYVLSPVYESKSTMLVTSYTENLNSNNPKNDFNSILQAVPQFPVLTMNSYISQANSEILMERIIKKLKLDEKGYTSQSLNNQIMVTNPKGSSLLEVTVRNNNPGLTVDIANAFCQEYMALMNEKRQEYIHMSILSMVEEADKLNQQLFVATNDYDKNLLKEMISTLEGKINNTKIARSINVGNNQLILFAPATNPNQPVGPSKLMNMVIAFISGLMLSILIIIFLTLLSLSKKNIEEESQIMVSNSL